MTMAERFWSKVPNRPIVGCWEWAASIRPQGYGQFRLSRRIAPQYAHRISYELAFGPIPDGMLVRHRCDNPLCVRPDHLEVGTQSDNMMDAVHRGRHARAKTVGQRNGAAKLTDAQTAEIRLATESLSALSRRYGVSPQRISQIRRQVLDEVGVPQEDAP